MSFEYTEILKKIAVLFQSPETFGKGSSCLAQIYYFLSELETKGPLSLMNFPQSKDYSQVIPKSMQEIIKSAEEAFKPRPLLEMREPLKQLMDFCNKNQYRFLPEARLLRHQAKRWLDSIEIIEDKFDSQASLEIYLSPSLDLDCCEEGEKDDNLRFTNLPLAITNTGHLPALEIYFSFNIVEGSLFDSESDDQDIDQDLLNDNKIEAGQTQFIYKHFNYASKLNLEICGEYKDFLSHNSSKSVTYPVELPIRTVNVNANLPNPYVPDIPLTSERHWKELMKGEHSTIIEKIIMDNLLESGRIYVIRGLKRTGKTSVLRELEWEMHKNNKLLPVYIDIYNWWFTLHNEKIQVNSEDLLYEFANTLASQTEEYFNKANRDKIHDYLHTHQNEMSMKYDDFEGLFKIISEVSDDIRKHVVFLLDELDYWIGAREFENAQALLLQINNLVQQGFCSFVLSHEWTDREWWNKFRQSKITPLPFRVVFLEKDDIKELAGLTFLPYTEMAIEFIWRITGGWPGLVQLLFYWIVEEARKYSGKKILVDIEIVKKVIKNILISVDSHPFVSYFLESFNNEEMTLLRVMVDQQLIQNESSEIKYLRLDSNKGFLIEEGFPKLTGDIPGILKTLYQKQILEPINTENKRCRLRVGLLSYPAVLDLYKPKSSKANKDG